MEQVVYLHIFFLRLTTLIVQNICYKEWKLFLQTFHREILNAHDEIQHHRTSIVWQHYASFQMKPNHLTT